MKRIQSKLHKIGTEMFEKSLCHVLMVNVTFVVGAANTLAYFHVDELILVA